MYSISIVTLMHDISSILCIGSDNSNGSESSFFVINEGFSAKTCTCRNESTKVQTIMCMGI